MGHKFSILTACYNSRAYLKDCIDSVMSQTYPDFEWIIVDDSTTDGSWDLIEDISDSRVISVRNDCRLYCSSSYSRALSMATGDICCILDSDDALLPKSLAIINKMYSKHTDVGYIYTQHWWCDINLTKTRKGISSMPPKDRNGHRLSVAQAALKYHHCFSHWRTFRRNIRNISVIFPNGLRVAVDKHMGFAIEELCPGGFYSKPLYKYRYYRGNMSKTYAGDQKKMWQLMAAGYIEKRLKQKISVFPIKLL